MQEAIQKTAEEQNDPKLAAYRARLRDFIEKQKADLPRLHADAVGMLAVFNHRKPDPEDHDENVQTAFGSYRKRQHAIQVNEDKLRLSRPATDADIAYRQRVRAELARAIAENSPEGLPLRFHGTPFYNVQGIFQAHGLSSSVDRLGAASSYDAAGQVSVTTADTLETTLDSYTGLLDEGCLLPPGCIFVLLPGSEREARAGSSMLMGNVDFQEHPEQLFGILTSPETIDDVRQWSSEAGVDPTKVHEFMSFPDELGRLNHSIQNGEVQLQSLVPYVLGE